MGGAVPSFGVQDLPSHPRLYVAGDRAETPPTNESLASHLRRPHTPQHGRRHANKSPTRETAGRESRQHILAHQCGV